MAAAADDGGRAWSMDAYDDGDGDLERTASEQECDLMIEALRRELRVIKNQLAWLTYNLDGSEGEEEGEEEGAGEGEEEGGEEGAGEGEEEREEEGGEEGGEEGVEENRVHSESRIQSSKLSGARSSVDSPHTAMKKVEKAKEEQERAIRAALAEKERKRYYMAVVDKAEEDKKTFHDKCLQLMRVHVEQQRQQVQEASERLRRRMKKRQRREKALKLQKKPIHFRSTLCNDATFLNKLYHSTFYQIIGVEHQMKKAGKLNGLTDLKEFWELMLGPPSPSPPPLTSHPAHPLATPAAHTLHPFSEEEEEEGVDSTSWALTTLPPEKYRVIEDSERPGASCKPQATSEPLRLPQVRPIADILNHGSPATQHTLSDKAKAREHRSHMQAVKDGRRCTRHMYQQARANEMAMRKLLPDISSLELDDAGDDPSPYPTHPVQDVLTDNLSHQGSIRQQRVVATTAKRDKKLSPMRPVQKKEKSHPERIFPLPSSRAISSGKLSRKPHSVTDKPLVEEKAELPPLTMNNLLQVGNVKESKGKGALWSNYR